MNEMTTWSGGGGGELFVELKQTTRCNDPIYCRVNVVD